MQYLTSNVIDPGVSDLTAGLPNFDLAERPESIEDTITPSTGAALYVDAATKSMKGAWFDSAGNLMYFPHADVITNTVQADVNDFSVMGANMCSKLHPAGNLCAQ